jgi:hypothetical protein
MNTSEKKIGSFFSLDVEILSKPNEDVRNHLTEMILGTPGRLQYRFTEIDQKLSWLKDCKFLILKKSGKIIGSICLIRRKSPVLRDANPQWYIRYFFIRAPLRPKSYKLGKKKRDTSVHLNLIWNSVSKYFEQPESLIDISDQTRKSLLYSYVQKSNIRAINNNNSVGLIPVKKSRTYFFSRIRPARNTCVRQFQENEKEHIINLLREFYRDYMLYTEQNLFFNGQYYVYVKDNEIVAGMQANPEAWQFLNKPGLLGFILIKVLPRIPVISRYWKPDNFRFTAIEGLFFKQGHEDIMVELMESVCAIHQTNFIFYWLDPSSKINNIITKPGVRGFLSRFLPSEEINICIKFINWKEEEVNDFIKKTAYISCFDST